MAVLLLLPTLLSAIYYGAIASKRYVSEARFVVRTAAKTVSGGNFGALLQMTGLSKANNDVYAVQSFLASRDAARQLAEKLPLREFFGHRNTDMLSRYPSILHGDSFEQFHRYLATMVSATYSTATGITTLRVQAFHANDAKRIADELLLLGEQAINRMNDRIQKDAQRVSNDAVKRNQQRLIAAQVALTRFRNSELMIDPGSSSVIVTELMGLLSADLAKVEAQIREAAAAANNNPALAGLKRRAAAIKEQLLHERRKISDSSGGLAVKLAEYERLVLEREFAKTALSAAVKALASARAEARRQQLYLERVVTPVAADFAQQPKRLRIILTVFCLNAVALLVGWLFYAGIREHGAAG